MSNTHDKDEDNPSDGEKLDDAGEAEKAGSKKFTAPPPCSDLSLAFSRLLIEQMALSAGSTEAGHLLVRKAKMSLLAAHAAEPARQADIRAFGEQDAVGTAVKHNRQLYRRSFFFRSPGVLDVLNCFCSNHPTFEASFCRY